MALIGIQHKDGRYYETTEAGFEELYKPFGFKPVSVIFDGKVQEYSAANVKAANEWEAETNATLNVTPVTLETAARQRMEEEANAKAAEKPAKKSESNS